MLQKDFGKKVKQLRKLANFTQEQLAAKVKMDYKYLGAIERGEKNLTIENIKKISIGFNIEPYQLFLFSNKIAKDEEGVAEDKIKDILENITKEKKNAFLKIMQIINAI